MPTTASFDCHPLSQPPIYQQLFRPLDGSHKAVASRLTDSSKFKVTVKSDTDILAVVFSICLFCFVHFLFILFFIYCFFFLLFFFFVFFFKFFSLIYVHVTVYTY